MALKLVTPPAIELITLQEAKVHLRLDLGAHPEDVLIAGLCIAAREWCERFREECFITQTWDYFRDDFPGEVAIPLGPIQSVTYIKVKDSAGTVAETSFMDGASPEAPIFSTADYALDIHSRPPRLVKVTGADAAQVTGQINALQIRMVVGYGDLPWDVPEKFRIAVLLALAHLYEHRGDEGVGMSPTVELLLRQDLVYPMP